MKYTYEILLLHTSGCSKHLSLEMFDFFVRLTCLSLRSLAGVFEMFTTFVLNFCDSFVRCLREATLASNTNHSKNKIRCEEN